jgi:hypothetical protein
VLIVRGRGPHTRYAFPGGVPQAGDGGPRPGRRPKWTDATIEAELRQFLAAERDGWPSFEEFREAGKGALYAAMSRAGGIKRWRQIVGE